MKKINKKSNNYKQNLYEIFNSNSDLSILKSFDKELINHPKNKLNKDECEKEKQSQSIEERKKNFILGIIKAQNIKNIANLIHSKKFYIGIKGNKSVSDDDQKCNKDDESNKNSKNANKDDESNKSSKNANEDEESNKSSNNANEDDESNKRSNNANEDDESNKSSNNANEELSKFKKYFDKKTISPKNEKKPICKNGKGEEENDNDKANDNSSQEDQKPKCKKGKKPEVNENENSSQEEQKDKDTLPKKDKEPKWKNGKGEEENSSQEEQSKNLLFKILF